MWGFNEYGDGLILCKLINDFVPDTIDTRILNKPNALKPLNADGEQHHRDRNYKGIGCSVVWQIIRRGLLAQVDIKIHPELYRLCKAGETIDDLLQLTPDQILLAWFNYHLKAAGWKRKYTSYPTSSPRPRPLRTFSSPCSQSPVPNCYSRPDAVLFC